MFFELQELWAIWTAGGVMQSNQRIGSQEVQDGLSSLSLPQPVCLVPDI